MTIEQLTRLKEHITDLNLACYWEGYYMYAPHKDAHQKHSIYKQKVHILHDYIDNILIELSKEVKQ